MAPGTVHRKTTWFHTGDEMPEHLIVAVPQPGANNGRNGCNAEDLDMGTISRRSGALWRESPGDFRRRARASEGGRREEPLPAAPQHGAASAAEASMLGTRWTMEANSSPRPGVICGDNEQKRERRGEREREREVRGALDVDY